MKWAIISETFPPDLCGAGAFAARLGDHLVAEEQSVWVLTRPGQLAPSQTEIVPILKGSTYVTSVRRWVLQHSPDVLVMNYAYSDASVFRHNISSAVLAWVVSWRLPVLGIFHEIPQTPITLRNVRSHLREIVSLPMVAAVVVPDRTLVRGTSAPIRWLAGRGNRLLELPVPSNIELSEAGPDPQYENFSVGVFGVIKPKKGIEFALRCFADAGMHLIVVGGGDPSYLNALRARFGGSEGHRITGWVPDSDVSRILQTVPCWVLPFVEDGCTLKSTSWAAVRWHGGYTITTHKFRSGYSPELNTTFIPWKDRYNAEAWVRLASRSPFSRVWVNTSDWTMTAQTLIRVANDLVRPHRFL